MQTHFRTMDGKIRWLDIPRRGSFTTDDLRDRIAAELGVDRNTIRVIAFGTKVMEDGQDARPILDRQSSIGPFHVVTSRGPPAARGDRRSDGAAAGGGGGGERTDGAAAGGGGGSSAAKASPGAGRSVFMTLHVQSINRTV